MDRKIFLRGEVEQPLWLPPRFSGFVQTYKFGEKHTWKLLVYHPYDDSGTAYNALHIFKLLRRTTPVDIDERTGKITANSFTDIEAMPYKAPVQEGYEEIMARLCESERMDAFYAPIDRKPDSETLGLVVDFALLYFTIGSANGDYRKDYKKEGEKQDGEPPNIVVARNEGLILPGDPQFNMP